MLILLSPAKNVNAKRAEGRAVSAPRFLPEAEELVSVARHWSAEDISRIMEVSDTLARLNRDRFARWTPRGGCAAGLMFDGDVYRELDLQTLDDGARADAAQRLRLLSGLYGLLRPGDAVEPYRLEMGRKCPGHPAGTLYRFWGDRIARAVARDAADLGTDTVLNLASQEYAKAVDPSGLGGLAVVTPRFEEDRPTGRKVIAVMAKRARGAMARWVIQTGASRPEDLHAFDVGGYAHDPEASCPAAPVFLRG